MLAFSDVTALAHVAIAAPISIVLIGLGFRGVRSLMRGTPAQCSAAKGSIPRYSALQAGVFVACCVRLDTPSKTVQSEMEISEEIVSNRQN